MKSKSRGFTGLIGRTIKSVNTTAINVVTLTFTDGSKYEIGAHEMHAMIPIVECEQVKRKNPVRLA